MCSILYMLDILTYFKFKSIIAEITTINKYGLSLKVSHVSTCPRHMVPNCNTQHIFQPSRFRYSPADLSPSTYNQKSSCCLLFKTDVNHLGFSLLPLLVNSKFEKIKRALFSSYWRFHVIDLGFCSVNRAYLFFYITFFFSKRVSFLDQEKLLKL